MKNILVTGGAGFVGTNLIKRLLHEDYTVYSLDNYSTGLKTNHIDGCNYIIGDINDIDVFKTYLHDIDAVFHLAARARIQPSFEVPEEYMRSNYQGTYEVIKYCTRKDIPLFYAGSSSHHSGKFKNPYTFSKTMGEEIIELYQKHFNLKSSTARFYNVYGPYQLTEGGYTTLIGKWLNCIENGINCTVYGDGFKRRDFTHVNDIVDALIKMMQQQAYGYTFELGRGENHSINEVAVMMGIIPNYEANRPGEAQNTLADSSLAKDILGWEAKLNLIDYIKGEIR